MEIKDSTVALLMKYEAFTYFTPPRTDAKIPRSLLSMYERKGWIAQVKKNGANSLIFVGPDRVPFAYNRHGEPHQQWNFSAESARIFSKIPGERWWVFNAELLHSKVNGGPRDTNYVHDVLVAEGELLLGKRYSERLTVLRDILHDARRMAKLVSLEADGYTALDDHTWLARNFQQDFCTLYDNLAQNEDEGLVLKDPHGRLSTTDGKGAAWMVKIRRATKNFGF